MSLLRLSSVAKSYRRGTTAVEVLADASLTVERGSVTALYGARGSGKTTVLRIAAGFEAPDAGAVLLDGKPLDSVPGRGRRGPRPDAVGWVHAAAPLHAHADVETSVALPRYRDLGRRRAHDRARSALAAVGAADCAGERWTDLPDLASALCAIAHATVREPKLIVADDPTAGLGAVDRERICALLRNLAEEEDVGVLTAVPGMTSMLGAHRMLMLSRGRLLAPLEPSLDGPGGEVVELPRRSA